MSVCLCFHDFHPSPIFFSHTSKVLTKLNQRMKCHVQGHKSVIPLAVSHFISCQLIHCAPPGLFMIGRLFWLYQQNHCVSNRMIATVVVSNYDIFKTMCLS